MLRPVPPAARLFTIDFVFFQQFIIVCNSNFFSCLTLAERCSVPPLDITDCHFQYFINTQSQRNPCDKHNVILDVFFLQVLLDCIYVTLISYRFNRIHTITLRIPLTTSLNHVQTFCVFVCIHTNSYFVDAIFYRTFFFCA